MGTSLPSTRQSKQQNKSQRCSSSSLSLPLLLPWPWLRIKHLDHRLMPMPPTTSTSLDMVMVDTHSLVLDTTIQATSIMDTDPLTIHTMDMDPLTMDMEDTDPVMDMDAFSETRRTELNYENGFLKLLQLPTFDSFSFNINLVKLW